MLNIRINTTHISFPTAIFKRRYRKKLKSKIHIYVDIKLKSAGILFVKLGLFRRIQHLHIRDISRRLFFSKLEKV